MRNVGGQSGKMVLNERTKFAIWFFGLLILIPILMVIAKIGQPMLIDSTNPWGSWCLEQTIFSVEDALFNIAQILGLYFILIWMCSWKTKEEREAEECIKKV